MGMNIIVENLLHERSHAYSTWEKGDYYIQAYLSSIQPKSLEIVCSREVVVLKVDLTPEITQ
jgi:hypothetical protein